MQSPSASRQKETILPVNLFRPEHWDVVNWMLRKAFAAVLLTLVGEMLLGSTPVFAETNLTQTVSSADTKIAPSSALDVTYIANEGFMIEAAGKKVLIDGLFENGFGIFAQPSVALQEQMTQARSPFSKVDLILITHRHDDHFSAKLVTECLHNNPGCRLIADRQVVDLLRKTEGFSRIQNQVRELTLKPGQQEHLTVNSINVTAVGLVHIPMYRDGRNVNEGLSNVGFLVDFGQARFFHGGDASLGENKTNFASIAFTEKPLDVLFVMGVLDRSPETAGLVAARIKPRNIIGMHLRPDQFAEESSQFLKTHPGGVVFHESLEQHQFSH
jgi:L-ascorbate metabolism protein UlaG (beta-lactamase superfamily)